MDTFYFLRSIKRFLFCNALVQECAYEFPGFFLNGVLGPTLVVLVLMDQYTFMCGMTFAF